MKVKRSGCIWDIFWRSAGLSIGEDTGVGGFGRTVRKRKEVVVDWGKSMFSGRKSDGMYETC